MTQKVYNTLTRTKEAFSPREPGKISMYVCGPTVYDVSHIGHARKEVVFDVIYRYLKSAGYDVTFVRNVTDVDDKIITRANAEGASPEEIATKYLDAFHRDIDALGVLRPDIEPKATEHIEDMIRVIETLIEKGYGYAAGGDVYFSVEKFDGYGKLSGRRLDEMVPGARVGVDERKTNPMDFVLWKSAKTGEPSWPSPWGDGRPGWHIECSTMSGKYLGDTIDIHGGGVDLVFPHHENEIAQSEAANGEQFVRTWMHNGLLTVDGEKMSKSLGNYYTIADLLALNHPEVIRYFLIASHYRSPVDFTGERLLEAQKRLDYFYGLLQRLRETRWEASAEGALAEELLQGFHASMEDDFNIPAVLGVLSSAAGRAQRALDDIAAGSPGEDEDLTGVDGAIRKIGEVLGLFRMEPADWFKWTPATTGGGDSEIEALVEARTQARKDRDWAEADRLRDELKEMGVVIEDGPEGTTWRRAR